MRSTLREHRLAVLGVAALLALLVAAAVVLNRIGGSDGFSLASAGGGWAYLVVFGLILGDAVVPVLPGETTLNTGATLAAAGSLDLVLVMVAGALGAIVGDSALYWIARLGRRRIRPQVARAESNEKVALALEYMGSSAPVLIVAGRYVPGLRFVVNATMGISEFPYRRFLLWSSIGGALWSVYTCGLAYLIGTALAGFPLASVVISGAVTTAAIAVLAIYLRRGVQLRRRGRSAPPADPRVPSRPR
jgi:membrane protein DedA with SNARE-associated domain